MQEEAETSKNRTHKPKSTEVIPPEENVEDKIDTYQNQKKTQTQKPRATEVIQLEVKVEDDTYIG